MVPKHGPQTQPKILHCTKIYERPFILYTYLLIRSASGTGCTFKEICETQRALNLCTMLHESCFFVALVLSVLPADGALVVRARAGGISLGLSGDK